MQHAQSCGYQIHDVSSVSQRMHGAFGPYLYRRQVGPSTSWNFRMPHRQTVTLASEEAAPKITHHQRAIRAVPRLLALRVTNLVLATGAALAVEQRANGKNNRLSRLVETNEILLILNSQTVANNFGITRSRLIDLLDALLRNVSEHTPSTQLPSEQTGGAITEVQTVRAEATFRRPDF